MRFQAPFSSVHFGSPVALQICNWMARKSLYEGAWNQEKSEEDKEEEGKEGGEEPRGRGGGISFWQTSAQT